MPRIEKFFANQNVKDWTGKSLGGGGAEAFAVDPTSGNTTTPYSGYESREFTSSGTFTVTSGAGVVDLLIVSGGGGAIGGNVRHMYFSPGYGGSYGGGGGAGGGVQEIQGMAVSSTGGPAGNGVYPVVVGAGGAGGAGQTDTSPGQPSSFFGVRGGSSSFGGITVPGGGAGRFHNNLNPKNPFTNPTYVPGLGMNSVGYNGGGGPAMAYPPAHYTGSLGAGGPGSYGGGDGFSYTGAGGASPIGYGGNAWEQSPGTWPTSTPQYPLVSPVIGVANPAGAGPSTILLAVAGRGAAGQNSFFKGGPSAPVYYGGGGSGGMGFEPGNRPGPGGYGLYVWPAQPGGGGHGGASTAPSLPGPNQPGMQPIGTDGGNGTANSGGGGGGGGMASDVTPNLVNPYPDSGDGGTGGSGVVVVRWAV